jgi:hypothetical protein
MTGTTPNDRPVPRRGRLARILGGLLLLGCLCALSACGEDVQIDYPAAATPVLLDVRGNAGSVGPMPGGSYPVLPLRAVHVDVKAPWPADLKMKLPNGHELAKAESQQSWTDGETAGDGAWGVEEIDVGTSPPTWKLTISPPPDERLCGFSSGVNISSVSLNQTIPAAERESQPLNVSFVRAVPIPFSVPLTGARMADGRGVHLEWEKIPSARTYHVFRAFDPSGTASEIASFDAAQTTYDDHPLALGPSYAYVVSALRGGQMCGMTSPAVIRLPDSGTEPVGLRPVDPNQYAQGWATGIPEYTPKPSVLGAVTNRSQDGFIHDTLGYSSRDMALWELSYEVNGTKRTATNVAGGQRLTTFQGMPTGGRFFARPMINIVCIPLGGGPRRGGLVDAPCDRADVDLLVEYHVQ